MTTSLMGCCIVLLKMSWNPGKYKGMLTLQIFHMVRESAAEMGGIFVADLQFAMLGICSWMRPNGANVPVATHHGFHVKK